MSASFIEHFSQLRDPRVECNKRYPLMEILLLAVGAMLSGAGGWQAREKFGKAKLDWVRQFARFANGVPPHDRIAAAMSQLNPKTFQACFCSWTRAVAEVTDGEVVALDSTARRRARLA